MTRKGYGESTGKIILIGEHAVTFGEPAIAVPFNAGKIKVLIEALESGNYSSIKSDVYDGMLYDAPDGGDGVCSVLEAPPPAERVGHPAQRQYQ